MDHTEHIVESRHVHVTIYSLDNKYPTSPDEKSPRVFKAKFRLSAKALDPSSLGLMVCTFALKSCSLPLTNSKHSGPRCSMRPLGYITLNLVVAMRHLEHALFGRVDTSSLVWMTHILSITNNFTRQSF